MTFLDRAHGGFVFPRRIAKLSDAISKLIPAQSEVLDIGCGDGQLAATILTKRSDIRIRGIDVLVRKQTFIPVNEFNGITIPYDGGSFDVSILVDVLHHTDDPAVLLREAMRVSRRGVIVKDHTKDGLLAGTRLRFMDWVGNARHGVVLPYNYWSQATWQRELANLNCESEHWITELGLYPVWADWLFGSSLHFVAFLRPKTKP